MVKRVEELADQHGVSMTEISIVWLLTKVASPVMGVTRKDHIDGAIKATELLLTAQEMSYLEEAYVAHKRVGAMAQNNE